MAVVITTAIQYTPDPPHLLKSTTAQPSSAHGIHLISSTTSAEHRMRFVIPSCTPDDGHNNA
jgi:hypothetical protein